MEWHNEEGFTFKDVLIRPGYSKLKSRLSTDPYVDFYNWKLSPIMVANMLDVATLDMWKALTPERILVPFSRIHKSFDERIHEVSIAHSERKDMGFEVPIATSIGIAEIDAALKLYDFVDVFFLDVAYAYTKQILDRIVWMKKQFPTKILIVGNVGTEEAAKDLYDHGADLVKVGIGPSGVCTTRVITGCGIPQLSAIIECANEADIIADGGITGSDDCIKGLAAGAKFVMIGGLFAGSDEAYEDETGTKIYRGLASNDVRANKRGIIPEGISTIVPRRGPAVKIAQNLMSGIRQGMGLVGAKNLYELREKAVFQRVTHCSTLESQPGGRF